MRSCLILRVETFSGSGPHEHVYLMLIPPFDTFYSPMGAASVQGHEKAQVYS